MATPFTPGQRQFIDELHRRTGLNRRVIGSWVLSEMNGGAARSREAEGNYNWLNIAYYDSGPGNITKSGAWHSPSSAAAATADFLKGKRFGPSPGIRKIITYAGKSPDEQINAIANSGWASSGYGGGSTLRSVYGRLGWMGEGATTTRAAPSSRAVPATAATPVRRQLAAQWLLSSSKSTADLENRVARAEAAVPAQTVTPKTKPTVRAASPVSGHGPGDLKELFWQGQGGIDVKNGQLEPQGFVSGHTDHVHVASGPKQVLRIAKKAQQMGLHVGENPAYGGVAPVHVPNSYHYRGQAIDVSGDPAKMRQFAAWVARAYGVKR